jgi:hypothetical protein
MVLAVSYRIPPVPHYSGYYTSIRISVYRAITCYGSSFQMIQLDLTF